MDWKNLYKRRATPKEQLRGEEPVTQFGRMCAKLGIELIAASSPQAKGRVERILPEHNGRFARVAAKPEDYHRRAPRASELERIFRLEKERTISEDWVVRYENRYFQLAGRHYAPAEG